MKQPDRFARAVGTHRHIARDGMGYVLLEETARHLMRLEHRRVVRLVKGLEQDVRKVKRIVGKGDVHAEGMLDGVQCVLAALARRAT